MNAILTLVILFSLGCQAKYCGRNKVSENGRCVPCTKCDIGYGYLKGCGYGDGIGEVCERCPEGYFNDGTDDMNKCQQCRDCNHLHRETLYKCRPEINAACGPCIKGYFNIFEHKGEDAKKEACSLCLPSTQHSDCVNLKTSTQSMLTQQEVQRNTTLLAADSNLIWPHWEILSIVLLSSFLVISIGLAMGAMYCKLKSKRNRVPVTIMHAKTPSSTPRGKETELLLETRRHPSNSDSSKPPIPENQSLMKRELPCRETIPKRTVSCPQENEDNITLSSSINLNGSSPLTTNTLVPEEETERKVLYSINGNALEEPNSKSNNTDYYLNLNSDNILEVSSEINNSGNSSPRSTVPESQLDETARKMPLVNKRDTVVVSNLVFYNNGYHYTEERSKIMNITGLDDSYSSEPDDLFTENNSKINISNDVISQDIGGSGLPSDSNFPLIEKSSPDHHNGGLNISLDASPSTSSDPNKLTETERKMPYNEILYGVSQPISTSDNTACPNNMEISSTDTKRQVSCYEDKTNAGRPRNDLRDSERQHFCVAQPSSTSTVTDTKEESCISVCINGQICQLEKRADCAHGLMPEKDTVVNQCLDSAHSYYNGPLSSEPLLDT